MMENKKTKYTKRQIEDVFRKNCVYAITPFKVDIGDFKRESETYDLLGIPISKATEIFGEEVISHVLKRKNKPLLNGDQLLELLRTDERFLIESEKGISRAKDAAEIAIATGAAFWNEEGSEWLLAKENGNNTVQMKNRTFLTFTGTKRAAEYHNYLLKKSRKENETK